MPFADLEEFLRPGFDLPVRGTTYYIPPPSAKDGLWLQSLIDAGESLIVSGGMSAAQKQILGDDDERSMYQMALGPAWDAMLADDVPWPIVKHAGLTACLYWTRGPEAAEKAWARFGSGKAPAAEAAGPPTPTRPQPVGSPSETPTPIPA